MKLFCIELELINLTKAEKGCNLYLKENGKTRINLLYPEENHRLFPFTDELVKQIIFHETPRCSMDNPLAISKGHGGGCETEVYPAGLESNGVHMEYGVGRAIMEDP
ncbi:hypothetical protein PCH_Pc21g18240 [Penicillium rubens Wisconsin 54-1255]|uniref:Uncharacterized protein n=1 Tax=Penicillium rubens (strain ATCC 28089 / DSM 1075 / NRRL 1951 / Wisconsin 54-1255) TaxID=500485 RepID=B6HNV1_PENRW|nr:hypothetical protein PCH_Pc21g18240 [Penicillium rubens Wisconsin 54-1255]